MGSTQPLYAFFSFFMILASSLKLRIVIYVLCLIYLVLTGVHMGSIQVLPNFFANPSLSLAPIFLMVVVSSLF
jgi:hypothetical protein